MSDSFKMEVKERPEDYELFHYGVKGMRWGVRRPVDSTTGLIRKGSEERKENRAAKRETKAQKFEAKAEGYRSRIDNLKNVPAENLKLQKSNAKLIKKLEKAETRSLKDADRVREGKLTSTQRKVAIGAAVVATYVTYRAVDYNLQSGNFNRMAQRGKAFMEGRDPSDFKKASFLANKDFDVDQLKVWVADGVNPDYGGIGTKVNCRRCTFAYEMRRRGLDVQATKTTKGTGQNLVGLENALSPGKKERGTSLFSILKDVSKEAYETRNAPDAKTPYADLLNAGSYGKIRVEKTEGKNYGVSLFESIAKQPSGARGEVGVGWKAGGGHSMAYEIVKGKPVIFDTQTGKVYKSAEDFAKLGSNIKEAGLTRLDNVDLNTDYLLKWVKDA